VIAECIEAERANRSESGTEDAECSSLSKCHNSDNQQPDLPFRLTGSQKKTAYALRYNVTEMIKEAGLGCVGFLTLTVGDHDGAAFRQVHDAEEASRRVNNLNRRVLPELFERAVIVTERHQNGAIHFHVIGVLIGRPDIRKGFDFDSFTSARAARTNGKPDARAESSYKLSASDGLRALWAHLRATLPKYGFGRAELTPVRKTGDAIASYVAKYVEKNLFNRTKGDHRKKLVRYLGWDARQLKPNQFSWATPGAIAWRRKTAQLAGLVGIKDRGEMAPAFGPRWAWRVTRVSHAVDDGSLFECDWNWPQRSCARRLMVSMAPAWCRRKEAERSPSRGRWEIRSSPPRAKSHQLELIEQ
jgi:hypothetical protein